MSVEKNAKARAIMESAQEEELKPFGMDLEFLFCRTPKRRTALKSILFKQGDIVALGKRGEDAEETTG
jgi:uncharacterized protein